MESAKTVHKFVVRVSYVGLRQPTRRVVHDRYSDLFVVDSLLQCIPYLDRYCPGDFSHKYRDLDYFIESVSISLSLDPDLWFLSEGK